MPRIRPTLKTIFCLLLGTSLITACSAPLQQTTGSETPTATPGLTATPEPSVSPSPTHEPVTQEALEPIRYDAPGPLPPYLLSVTPDAGTEVGLDLRICATFDVSGDGMPGWTGPAWFEIAGAEEERPAVAEDERPNISDGSGCSSTLRHLLNEGTLDTAPPTGPVAVAVRYQEPGGVEHQHAWTVDLSLDAPEAPEEVHRIRTVYRPLPAIDAGKSWDEETIAGYFLKGDVLHVYLLDKADPEQVRSEVEAALGDEVPSGGIRLSQLDAPPDAQQLNAWVDEVREPVWSTEGIRLHSASGGCCNVWDRVTFGVGTASRRTWCARRWRRRPCHKRRCSLRSLRDLR